MPRAPPSLPCPDNPDPAACGSPTPWGSSETARLSGTEVVVMFFQDNPTLNYYLVKTVGPGPLQEGWVPAPFLEFDE